MLNAFAVVTGFARRYLGGMSRSRGRNPIDLAFGFVRPEIDDRRVHAPAPPLKLPADRERERLGRNMAGIQADLAAGQLEDVTDLSDEDFLARLKRH